MQMSDMKNEIIMKEFRRVFVRQFANVNYAFVLYCKVKYQRLSRFFSLKIVIDISMKNKVLTKTNYLSNI